MAPATLPGSSARTPLAWRICAVCDVFDALTSVRPDESARPIEDALKEIARQSGRDFGPRLVELVLGMGPGLRRRADEPPVGGVGGSPRFRSTVGGRSSGASDGDGQAMTKNWRTATIRTRVAVMAAALAGITLTVVAGIQLSTASTTFSELVNNQAGTLAGQIAAVAPSSERSLVSAIPYSSRGLDGLALFDNRGRLKSAGGPLAAWATPRFNKR
jgi:hypothetical protein